MTPDTTVRPVLLIVSDRPFVWVGFHSPDREVRRWVGERDSDEERASPKNFTGDPADPETYRSALESEDLSAVVDLQDAERAAGAIEALRRIRPGVGVLVITADENLNASQIAVSRKLAWTDALRGDLEGELRQLENVRRIHELRRFAEGDGDVPILVHPDPDPDALASALALRALLNMDPMHMAIVTVGEITRPENRRMSELLRLRVTTVTAAEVQKLDRIIAVDFQPQFDHCDVAPRVAILDHHPSVALPHVEFADVRPSYGATATMLTEYLRLDDERRIGETLATALLYGIKTDTDSLTRGCIAADVQAYAFLQSRADLRLLKMLERPSYSKETARLFGTALTQLESAEDLTVVFLGKIVESDAHVLADIADFCLGLEGTTWVVAGAQISDRVVLTIRHLGNARGAGDLAKRLTAERGNGGGHAAMARALLPLEAEWKEMCEAKPATASRMLLEIAARHLEGLRVSPRSSRPVRPEKVPSAAT